MLDAIRKLLGQAAGGSAAALEAGSITDPGASGADGAPIDPGTTTAEGVSTGLGATGPGAAGRSATGPVSTGLGATSGTSRTAASDEVALAACTLLLEIAHADGEFTAEERGHIESAMTRHFNLDPTAVSGLMTAAEVERRASVDHFQYTRQISASFDLGQKTLLAEIMWGVILADGQIARHEEYLVRKMANLLNLEPGYLSQARRAAGEKGKA